MFRTLLLLTIFSPLYLYASLTPERYLSYAIPILLLMILYWAGKKAYGIWKEINN